MNRPHDLLRGRVTAIRERHAAVAAQSERTILLGTILLASVVSAATGFVLAQYFSFDVLSSLLFPYGDCSRDWGMNIGRHCFSDYPTAVSWGMLPNPWDNNDPQLDASNYPAAALIPQTAFGLLGKLLGAPRLGLLGYLLALTIAVLTPAVWAARGARGLERIVVFVACGAFAVPAWTVIDRGNSVGFVAPIALAFLVALCRQRWALVATMVVLAALVKPQFVVLAVVLFAARQWRLGGLALSGAAIGNIAAYLLWPRDFPHTIVQSADSTLGYGNSGVQLSLNNVSFTRALLLIPDMVKYGQTGGNIPEDFLAGPRSLIGYAVLVLVVVSVLALGRRIPPVMAGIVLLITACQFAAVCYHYYQVFALPIAALVCRDPAGPPGSGIFDRPAAVGGRHRTVGICVSLAAALTIAQIALPIQYGNDHPDRGLLHAAPTVLSTAMLATILWLVTCAVIIVSYARRPASCASTGAAATLTSREPTSTATR